MRAQACMQLWTLLISLISSAKVPAACRGEQRAAPEHHARSAHSPGHRHQRRWRCALGSPACTYLACLLCLHGTVLSGLLQALLQASAGGFTEPALLPCRPDWRALHAGVQCGHQRQLPPATARRQAAECLLSPVLVCRHLRPSGPAGVQPHDALAAQVSGPTADRLGRVGKGGPWLFKTHFT